jgi:hypothetical protein
MESPGSESPTASQSIDFERLMRSVVSVDRTIPLRQQLEQSRRLLLSREQAFFSRAFLELITRPYSENLERTVEYALDAFALDLQRRNVGAPQSHSVVWDDCDVGLSQKLLEVACTFDKSPLPPSFSTSSPKAKQFISTLFSSLLDKLLSPTSHFRRNVSEAVFESPHPYPNNSDVVHKISLPGATRLEITFDERSRTESGHDFVRFYLPGGAKVGDDKYTGRGDSAHWPGTGRTPALVIEGSEVEARFRSDGSENDWGYKFTVVGFLSDSVIPCLRQRLVRPMVQSMCMYSMLESDHVTEQKDSLVAKFACLDKLAEDTETSKLCIQYFSSCHSARLRHFVCNTMFKLHSTNTKLFSPAGGRMISLKVLESDLQVDLETSLRTLKALQQITPKQITFESPHPYPNNSDVVHKISFPGASRLEIVFDPQCKTEKNCDYVRFVLPDGRVVGDDKYTGRSDSAHWAGVGSTPALVIEGSEVEARFHSDGSDNDWG